jgi:hypothetical protein
MASAVITVVNFWFHKIGEFLHRGEAQLASQLGIYRVVGNRARRDGEELVRVYGIFVLLLGS